MPQALEISGSKDFPKDYLKLLFFCLKMCIYCTHTINIFAIFTFFLFFHMCTYICKQKSDLVAVLPARAWNSVWVLIHNALNA